MAPPAPLPLALAGAAVGDDSGGSWLSDLSVALVTWLLVSLVASLLVARWLRARARANERLSVEIRREDWLASSDAAVDADRPPPPERR